MGVKNMLRYARLSWLWPSWFLRHEPLIALSKGCTQGRRRHQLLHTLAQLTSVFALCSPDACLISGCSLNIFLPSFHSPSSLSCFTSARLA